MRSDFVDLLIQEIDLKLQANQRLAGRELQTIFFGGGTPSLLTPDELERICAKLSEHFKVAENVEFTLECNPGTVDLEKLKAYKSLGANRLSFGVQSFYAEELAFLGRIHDADQARNAVSLARKAGFDNVSIDLIFALPGQMESILANTLREAMALETDHISAYNLIIERGTPLYRLVQMNKVVELDSDRSAELFQMVQRTIATAGFEQYEISNYAKSPEKRAKHNLVYWNGSKDYVSFGPSAHEFIGGERAWNVSSLEEYGKMIRAGKLPTINRERLSIQQRRTEILYLHLRSTGILLDDFREVFGEDLLLNPNIGFFIEDGILINEAGLLKLTQKGYRFCDGVVAQLMEDKIGEYIPILQ